MEDHQREDWTYCKPGTDAQYTLTIEFSFYKIINMTYLVRNSKACSKPYKKAAYMVSINY